jgi:L-ascorbate metabolism protein UlaG (beta-lactamase superfamily)
VKITKFTHSCVRVEADGTVLVIDPGIWAEPEALDGCDAVLVTHEHTDHVARALLADSGLPVYAPAGAAIAGLAFTAVRPGDTFTAAGVPVHAVGGAHAIVYGDTPPCVNLGYVVAGTIYHPGDALHVLAEEVQTLLVPMQASWLKTAEAIDFTRAVRHERSFGIHDGQINQRGLDAINGWLGHGDNGYRWLAPGEHA